MKLYIKSMLNIWTLLLFTHAVFDLWYVWYEFSPKNTWFLYYGKKSHFSEIVLPWKLLELSRNRRKFNIIINYANHIFNYFPYKIIFWWKKTVWKEIFIFSYSVAMETKLLLNL